MRWLMGLMAAMLALVCACSTSAARAADFQAAFSRLEVADQAGVVDTWVFYPTRAPEVPLQAGPFVISASRNAPMALENGVPLVLISHGRGGSPLGHRELAIALARAGFIVVLPTHTGDAAGRPRTPSQQQILMDRPRQASAALDAVLADPRWSAAVARNRISMIGYSAGGYTALILAGAQPNFSYAGDYCAQQHDAGSCPPAGTGSQAVAGTGIGQYKPVADPRIRALVLMDPLAVMFDAPGLAAVHVPTMLYRPQDASYLSAARNALAVASGLPALARSHVVPGNHFVFLDPCPPALIASGEPICQDAPGVDRVAIHRQIEAEVVDFLRGQP